MTTTERAARGERSSNVLTGDTTTGDEVATFLEYLYPVRETERGTVIELRALRLPTNNGFTTLCGYYDLGERRHRAALADSVRTLAALDEEQQPEGVYVTMNPLAPGLLNRSNATFSEARACASDADVLARRWLVVDVDPTRQARVSATDDEKRLAWEVIDNVRAELDARGWARPIVCDSGNGFHLWYPVELPVLDGGSVQAALKALAAKHNTPGAHIDTSVFNPSRIAKVPGSWARKGTNTKERPHRMARVLGGPQW